MRTPQSAYEEALSCLNTRLLKAGDSVVPCKESYKLGLIASIGQLNLSFYGVFPEAQSPPPDELESTQPKEIEFGQHLTCSQCAGECTDHYQVSNNIWCPKCAEGRIIPI